MEGDRDAPVPEERVVEAAQGEAVAEPAPLLVAGGASDLDGIRRLRDAGASAVILGEPLLSGAIEYAAATEAAA